MTPVNTASHVKPDHKFRGRLVAEQLKQDINIAQAGFPSDWKDEPLWTK